MSEKPNKGIDLKEGEGIRTAVDIIIFNHLGQVLLGERLALAGENNWAFPGGHQKTGELIKETAQRELEEELGKSTKVNLTDEIIAVRENKISPWFVPHITIMIKAIFLGGPIELTEPDRCAGWEWFDLNNLPKIMFSGEREILENYEANAVKVVTD